MEGLDCQMTHKKWQKKTDPFHGNILYKSLTQLLGHEVFSKECE